MDNNLIIPNEEIRITSKEIAEITGKMHKNVMQDIRKMEESWVKLCGLKFELTSQKVEQPNGGYRIVPMYSLNQLEFLYVITKYSNEMRAKLVMRWFELETAMRAEKDRKAVFYDEVMKSVDSFCVRKVAAQLRMTAQELNKLLCNEHIQYGQSGSYLPYAEYARRGFCKSRTFKSKNADGTVRTEHRTTWTEPGIAFIVDLVRDVRAKLLPKVKVVQLNLFFN